MTAERTVFIRAKSGKWHRSGSVCAGQSSVQREWETTVGTLVAAVPFDQLCFRCLDIHPEEW